MSVKTNQRFNLASAVMAFVIWGGWAFLMNHRGTAESGRSSPVISGLTQGIGSFVITLLMVRAVTWLFRKLPNYPMRTVVPTIVTVAVTGSCLVTVHALVGTPNIAQTVAPALSVAFVFNIYTARRLSQQGELIANRRRDLTGSPS